MVGNLVVLEDDEDKPALYYREHRGEDFTTGPNGLWPDVVQVEGEAEEDWPDGEGVVADPLWSDPSNGDFRLGEGSPAIDAGPADVSDDDGSLADLGAFGGPGGDWPYAL
jgi:diadenosine tetraphosphatase ApaH/serine/threonine PP2A family protein phosphatase